MKEKKKKTKKKKKENKDERGKEKEYYNPVWENKQLHRKCTYERERETRLH